MSTKQALIWAGTIIATMVVAGSCGLAVGAGTTPEAEVKTVTKTVKSEPEVVEVAPQACLDALDVAEDIFTLSGEALSYAADGMLAASMFDVPGINAATRDLEKVNDKVTPLVDEYAAASYECREQVK